MLGFPPVSLKLVKNHKDTEPESILQLHWRFLEYLSCFRIVSSALWCVYSTSRCNFSFCIPRTRHSWVINSSNQFSSVAQLCHTLCDHMNCSMPGLPVHHQLPEFTQTCPLSQWSHPTISSSVIPCSSCLQSFPGSEAFPRSQLFASGGQNIGVSASASVLPMNIQDWFPLGWTGWIFLQSKGLSRVFSNTTVQKHPFFSTQLSL